MKNWKSWLMVVLATLSTAAFADARRFPIPDRGTLALEVPDGWKDEVRKNFYPKRPFTIALTPPVGEDFVVLLSPTWPTDMRANRPGPGEVREGVRKSAEWLKSQATEPELAVVDFRSGEVFGSHYSATARAVKPGDYKHVTQGTFVLADLTVNFSIYTNEGGQDTVRKALAMMQSARRERP